MGVLRLRVASVLVACAALMGCGSSEPVVASEEPVGELPRVPNPPPRYAHSEPAPAEIQSGTVDPDAGMTIKCGGRVPFTCLRDDGTVVCSAHPCLPDCSRIGCVGGDVCRACDGGFRCIDPANGC